MSTSCALTTGEFPPMLSTLMRLVARVSCYGWMIDHTIKIRSEGGGESRGWISRPRAHGGVSAAGVTQIFGCPRIHGEYSW